MADDRMTRFDVELFEAAADEGRRNHRSTRQQLEHWTRLGRQISAHETAARRRICGGQGRGDSTLGTGDRRADAVLSRWSDASARGRPTCRHAVGRGSLPSIWANSVDLTVGPNGAGESTFVAGGCRRTGRVVRRGGPPS